MKKINKEYNYTISDIKKFLIKFPKLSKINEDITQKRMPLKYNTKLDWEKNERI